MDNRRRAIVDVDADLLRGALLPRTRPGAKAPSLTADNGGFGGPDDDD